MGGRARQRQLVRNLVPVCPSVPSVMEERARPRSPSQQSVRVPSRQCYIYKFPHAHNHRPSQSTDHSSGQAALGGGQRVERQPKQAVGSTPLWRSKISLKNYKEDFRTRPPLLDRRVGLVGELFGSQGTGLVSICGRPFNTYFFLLRNIGPLRCLPHCSHLRFGLTRDVYS